MTSAASSPGSPTGAPLGDPGPAPDAGRTTPPGPRDGELVARVRNGDRTAFDALAERYYRMVSILALQKVGHRADAEDIVQEAFVRAYRALDTLRDPDRFGGWVYHIALKLCIDWIRRRERREDTSSLEEPSVRARSEAAAAAMGPAPLDAMVEAEEDGKVLSAIGGLPDKYRVIVTLRYVQKLSYKEISSHLGEPPGTVANRIHRATKMLKDKLGLEDGAGPAPPLGEDDP